MENLTLNQTEKMSTMEQVSDEQYRKEMEEEHKKEIEEEPQLNPYEEWEKANVWLSVSFDDWMKERVEYRRKTYTRVKTTDYEDWRYNCHWFHKTFEEWMKEKEEYEEECRKDQEEMHKQWLEDTNDILAEKHCRW